MAEKTIQAALDCAQANKLPETTRQCYRILAEICCKQAQFEMAAN